MIKTMLRAVFGGTLVGSIASTLVVAAIDPGTRGALVGNVVWLSSFALLIALPVAFVYGLPAYLLLRRFRFANIFSAALAGAVPGLLWLIYEVNRISAAAVTVGVCIGLAFQLLARHAANKRFQPTQNASGVLRG